ncbi:MAG: hypothetical protein JNM93_04120 [Bacteriovoracaceae bacterium]|nr:hypothetical protein [Bacteriovoracaceae bacterium]
MKFLLALVLLSSVSVFAQTSTDSAQTETQPVENIVKEAKKDRKKKVEMCHDCGKPETECDCEGEEHKKNE